MYELLSDYNQNTNSNLIYSEKTVEENNPKTEKLTLKEINAMIKTDIPKLLIKDGIFSFEGNKLFDYNYEVNIINKCHICFNNENFLFCENCKKNICKNCIDNCKGHELKNLQQQKEASDKMKAEINNILSKYTFEQNRNIIIDKSAEKYDDIEKINKILQKDYFNYFHFENIDKCSKYLKNLCKETYNKDCMKIVFNISNFKGKKMRLFGDYFVKNNKEKIYLLVNGKISKLVDNIQIDYDENYLEAILIRADNGKNIYVDNMSCMFCGCESTEIKISHVKNGTILDLSHLKDISNMFKECLNLEKIDLYFLEKATNISQMDSLFNGCEELQTISNLDKLDTKSVSSMNQIFYDCKNLKNLEGLNNWVTNNVKELIETFGGCSKLEKIEDISKWNVENVILMKRVFKDCVSIKSLPDISKWEVKNVKSMKSMFKDCSSLVNFPDISNWNVQNVKNMKRMFKGCKKLIFHDLKKWKLTNIKHIDYMFFDCRKLIYTNKIHKIEDILNIDHIVDKKISRKNAIGES